MKASAYSRCCINQVSVCVCFPEAYLHHLVFRGWGVEGRLGKCSLQKVAKGGKLFLKAPATRQHRDRPSDLPRLPIQLQRSHNPSCPPRLMIAQLVSPSLLCACTHGLFHSLLHCWAHISPPPLHRTLFFLFSIVCFFTGFFCPHP